jgi:hypothetical protein
VKSPKKKLKKKARFIGNGKLVRVNLGFLPNIVIFREGETIAR